VESDTEEAAKTKSKKLLLQKTKVCTSTAVKSKKDKCVKKSKPKENKDTSSKVKKEKSARRKDVKQQKSKENKATAAKTKKGSNAAQKVAKGHNVMEYEDEDDEEELGKMIKRERVENKTGEA